MRCAGLILAAGRGSRFPSETGAPFPKVLRPVLGKPMVLYVIDALRAARIEDITLVVGFGADEVKRAVGECVGYATQAEQKGSGHAVACAREHYEAFAGHLVVMCGDSPLFTDDTIRRLIDRHAESGAVASLVTASLDDPTGYGRILRDTEGVITGVVEEKCASERERAIREVNGGAYAFDSRWLFANIGSMRLNEAGEYNLTDMIRVAVEQGQAVASIECDPAELLGVNNPDQLAVVEDILRSRQS